MISAGRILIKPCGEWKADVTYRMLDLVNHNGYAYLAKRTVIGIEPNGHPDEWHNLLDINKAVEEALSNELAESVGKMLEERFAEMLSEARYVTDLFADFDVPTFVRWDTNTANTPYKAGLTTCYEGFALVFGNYATNHTISAWAKGVTKAECFTHTVSDGTVIGWDGYINKSGGTMTGDLILNANPTRDMQAATKKYVDEVTKYIDNATLESYYAFCANVNSDAIDCAFGKNNEDRIRRLGLQMAMYAWFKGDSKEEYPFTELVKVNSLEDFKENLQAFSELISNQNLLSLFVRGLDNVYELSYPSDAILREIVYIEERHGSSSIVTRTHAFTVTQDMLNGVVPIFMFYKLGIPGQNTALYANLYFNNILVDSVNEDDENISDNGYTRRKKRNAILVDWSDYNITSPGDYEIKMELFGYYNAPTVSGCWLSIRTFTE